MEKEGHKEERGTILLVYILTYVDDCLVVSMNPDWVINELTSEQRNFKLKDVGEPTRYLGAEIGRYDMNNRSTWYMFDRMYLKTRLKK